MNRSIVLLIALLSLINLSCSDDDNCTNPCDDGEWTAMGSGLDMGHAGYGVSAFAVDGDELVAGVADLFPSGPNHPSWVFRWTGSDWDSLGNAFRDAVRTLIYWDGDLIAGGRFDEAGGVSADGVARWDGESWVPFGGGIDGYVNAMAVWDGRLVAGGRFTKDGEAQVRNVAAWDGTEWSAVGDPGDVYIQSLAVLDQDLIAAGLHNTPSHTQAWIGRWDGSTWHTFPELHGGAGNIVWSWINCTAIYQGRIVVGGNIGSSEGIRLNRIAYWEDEAWRPFGDGVQGIRGGTINSISVNGHRLVAGGYFGLAGEGIANSIAQWNGSSWTPLGLGVGGEVYATAVWQGSVVVGGQFLHAGSGPAANVALWRE